MDKMLIYFAVLIGLQAALCIKGEEITRAENAQMMERFIERERLLQTIEVLCPGHRDKFRNALTKSSQCWRNVEKSRQTTCALKKSHTWTCLEPLKEVLADCLPEKYRVLPHLVVDSMVTVSDCLFKPDQFTDTCGGLFVNLRNGTITSPLFPNFYPFKKYCMWEIEAEPQYRVSINFTHFELEGIEHSKHQVCEFDRVEVYSKTKDGNFKKHGSYCGSMGPGFISSEGNVMRIVFSSDSSVQRSGFAAVFSTDMDECAVNNGGCQHNCLNTPDSYICTCHDGFTLHKNGKECNKEDCKHEISVPFGTISSPNYPSFYLPRLDCAWRFSATPGHRIRVAFQKFELEHHDACSYDRLDIYDGSSTQFPSLGRFCGQKLPPLILATGNQLYISLKTDPSIQRTGFWATHYTICGGDLTATLEKQHIYSHVKFGSANYENGEECDWIIKSKAGSKIKISFMTLDIEAERNCGYDYVQIFDGIDSSASSLGKYCGSQIPPDITSTQTSLLIRFHSDDTWVANGFSLIYEAV